MLVSGQFPGRPLSRRLCLTLEGTGGLITSERVEVHLAEMDSDPGTHA